MLICSKLAIELTYVGEALSIQSKLCLRTEDPTHRFIDSRFGYFAALCSPLERDKRLLNTGRIQNDVCSCLECSDRGLAFGVVRGNSLHIHCVGENDTAKLQLASKHAGQHFV